MSSSHQQSKETGAASTLPAAVQEAFAALSKYDRGSSRATLLPIDQAVTQSKTDERARKELEQRLIAVLSCGSESARDYACVKLATIGTEASVPALASLLSDVRLATDARTALQAIPSAEASKALRDALKRLDGPAKIGAILSLGARRDAGSTRALTALLRDPDVQVQSAAAAALGEIGTSKAAKALRAFIAKMPEGIRQPVGDACLVCAEHLSRENHTTDAAGLYSALGRASFPRHILDAAKRGLADCQPAKIRA
jgi:HEAT repeat protein